MDYGKTRTIFLAVWLFSDVRRWRRWTTGDRRNAVVRAVWFVFVRLNTCRSSSADPRQSAVFTERRRASGPTRASKGQKKRVATQHVSASCCVARGGDCADMPGRTPATRFVFAFLCWEIKQRERFGRTAKMPLATSSRSRCILTFCSATQPNYRLATAVAESSLSSALWIPTAL